ncbi:MAG TPA: demethoxyubiquinone hydroxylase family protein [Chloroflexota bacterium]|nr:demethoxyubiquinone hydroxylase family protein [Chloroflexota bacterium]
MPETNPFAYNAPRKLTDQELARALRLDAMAELDAMNVYEAHMEATDNEDARKVLAFIARDEKEHYALFQELIRRLDGDQAEEIDGAPIKLDAILSQPLGASQERVDAAAAAGDAPERPGIGSLLGEPQT